MSVDKRSARELVSTLTRERLVNEPAVAALIANEPGCAVAAASMRATLEAVVAYGRSMGWSEIEVVGVVRGSLGRLLRDDLLVSARLVEFRAGGL